MTEATVKQLPREHLVTTPDELMACCAELAAEQLLGLDTEFVGEQSYHPQLCLVQIATAHALYLIDPMTVGPLDAFWKLIIDPAREVIVHAGREEIRLCYLASGQPPGTVFDLQIAAGLVGLAYPMGHANLVQALLGMRLSKGETLTDWRQRPLSRAQLRYAYDDVRYLLPLGRKLRERLEARSRLAWAREEFERLKVQAIPSDSVLAPLPEKWRKLRSLGNLDRRQLAGVRALFAWREELAARLNRPPRTLVRDDLLVEIVKRAPSTEHDLESIRGLAHRNLDAILQVLSQAKQLPLAECPEPAEREQDPLQITLAQHILTAVHGDVCSRRELAANLAASTQDLKTLLRAHFQGEPLPSDILLTQGWRAAHLLPDLLAVLHGSRAVRIADLQSHAPLAYHEVVA